MQGAALLERQHGIVSIDQVVQLGLTKDQVRHRVRRGSWRRIYPRVFSTAGRLQGLVDEDPGLIELTLGVGSPGHNRPGMRLHRSPAASERRHPARLPPQTHIEDTVLDLVAAATTGDSVVTWVLRACQRRLTTPARLAGVAEGRQRLRNRALFDGLVEEAADGVASALERRYRSDVEVAHGLPTARRNQVWTARDGRRRYFDVRYDEWRVRIELEGLAYHPADRSRWDAERDNAAVLMGDVVLRYGWHPVVRKPCAVAAQVGAVLTLRGWAGVVARCSPRCRAAGA